VPRPEPPFVVTLARGPFFLRVLLVAWAAAMVSHPPDHSLALYRVVGCESLPVVAGAYFAGLQVLITYWAVLRLRDAGQGPTWAALTWTGALPGLAAASGEAMAASLELLAYGFGILATLAIGALEPEPQAAPRRAGEGPAGRLIRRLLLPLILAQVLVLYPRSDAALARRLIEDGMRVAPVLQRAVEGRWRHARALPDSNFAAGLPPPESITGNAVALSGIRAGGVIFLVFDHPDLPCALQGSEVELVPQADEGRLRWRCVTSLPEGVRPRICRPGLPR